MKQLIIILTIASLFLSACTGESIEGDTAGEANALTLTYTIPDAVTGTRFRRVHPYR